MKKNLGTFKVESGKITISDPCYEPGEIYTSEYKALNGNWQALVEMNTEGRVSSLVVHHPMTKLDEGNWRKDKYGSVGVDSGQMSIFDTKYYRQPSEGANHPKAKYIKKSMEGENYDFYAAVCYKTNMQEGGVFKHGVCSSSGYGDGFYPVILKRNNKRQVVAVKIQFI